MPGVKGLRDGVVKGLSDTGAERVKTLPSCTCCQKAIVLDQFQLPLQC